MQFKMPTDRKYKVLYPKTLVEEEGRTIDDYFFNEFVLNSYRCRHREGHYQRNKCYFMLIKHEGHNDRFYMFTLHEGFHQRNASERVQETIQYIIQKPMNYLWEKRPDTTVLKCFDIDTTFTDVILTAYLGEMYDFDNVFNMNEDYITRNLEYYRPDLDYKGIELDFFWQIRKIYLDKQERLKEIERNQRIVYAQDKMRQRLEWESIKRFFSVFKRNMKIR